MKECLECKYCSVEDLWNELICKKHHNKLCPTKIIDNVVYYPICEDFEEDEENKNADS